jgi:hypothetical protein
MLNNIIFISLISNLTQKRKYVWIEWTTIHSRPLSKVWVSLLRFLRNSFSFTKFRSVQWRYVETFCTLFYTSRSINMGSEGRNSITPLSGVSTKLAFFFDNFLKETLNRISSNSGSLFSHWCCVTEIQKDEQADGRTDGRTYSPNKGCLTT